jgi:hypothetical protein
MQEQKQTTRRLGTWLKPPARHRVDRLAYGGVELFPCSQGTDQARSRWAAERQTVNSGHASSSR